MLNDYSPSQKVCAQLFTTDQNLYCLSLLRRNNGENPEELLICWDFIKKCESISSKNLIAIMLQNFSFKLIPSLCMTASGEITTEFPIFFFLSFREVKSITHQLACQVSGYTNNWLFILMYMKCTFNVCALFSRRKCSRNCTQDRVKNYCTEISFRERFRSSISLEIGF